MKECPIHSVCVCSAFAPRGGTSCGIRVHKLTCSDHFLVQTERREDVRQETILGISEEEME